MSVRRRIGWTIAAIFGPLVVAFAAGGFADGVARLVGQKLSEQLGQPVVIDNRGGAGGNIASRLAAAAPANGYTLLVNTAAISINVSLYKNLGYDPEKDFEPISLVGTQTNLLYTHPGSVPAKTLTEFVAYVKANPGKLTFGSGGIGTPAHLAGELLKVEAGIEMSWLKLLGEKGRFVGIHNFGASAPAEALYAHFGITPNAIVEAVAAQL